MAKLYDPLYIANNFIEKGKLDNKKISPMKLQKLMYFLYRDYLKLTGNPLFSERFEAWKYGPILSSVYHELKHYKDKNIKKYVADAEGNIYKVNEESNKAFRQTLNQTWETYKTFNGIELSEMTHQPGTAWYKAWMNDNILLSDADIANEGALIP